MYVYIYNLINIYIQRIAFEGVLSYNRQTFRHVTKRFCVHMSFRLFIVVVIFYAFLAVTVIDKISKYK